MRDCPRSRGRERSLPLTSGLPGPIPPGLTNLPPLRLNVGSFMPPPHLPDRQAGPVPPDLTNPALHASSSSCQIFSQVGKRGWFDSDTALNLPTATTRNLMQVYAAGGWAGFRVQGLKSQTLNPAGGWATLAQTERTLRPRP